MDDESKAIFFSLLIKLIFKYRSVENESYKYCTVILDCLPARLIKLPESAEAELQYEPPSDHELMTETPLQLKCCLTYVTHYVCIKLEFQDWA